MVAIREEARILILGYPTLVVGISATMCHSAEKIPAKEYASHRGLAKINKVSPPEYLNRYL